MHEHTIHLHERPFAMVRDGQKTIESRLNDEKRREFAVGDRLTFVSRNDRATVSATITTLDIYDTFAELFSAHDPAAFGGVTTEELLEGIRMYYCAADESRWGVVGIGFLLD